MTDKDGWWEREREREREKIIHAVGSFDDDDDDDDRREYLC